MNLNRLSLKSQEFFHKEFHWTFTKVFKHGSNLTIAEIKMDQGTCWLSYKSILEIFT